MSDTLTVEVAYAKPEQQFLIALDVPDTTTVAEAISASGILAQCPELNLGQLNVGIFGRVTTLDRSLKAGDRVEIYRPLIHDPKEARRQRASK
jgi:putative ubiquitin-RnfH superfamily antitoxin RatB of RatAB toxin-antitoxin module